jgi:hypothetical protein
MMIETVGALIAIDNNTTRKFDIQILLSSTPGWRPALFLGSLRQARPATP